MCIVRGGRDNKKNRGGMSSILYMELEEEIKDKIRKLPVERIEKVKEVLKEIKNLKEQGKDEHDSEMLNKYIEFKLLLEQK